MSFRHQKAFQATSYNAHEICQIFDYNHKKFEKIAMCVQECDLISIVSFFLDTRYVPA